MRKIIYHTFKLTLFWLCLFAIQRSIFLIYLKNQLNEIKLSEILLSFFYALRMDLSTTAYLMVLPAVLVIIALFYKTNKTFISTIHVINIILITICVIIGISDIGLYSVWGVKFNQQALSYLAYPKEVIHSFSAVPYWLFIGIILVEIFIFIYIYRKMFRPGYIAKIKLNYRLFFLVLIFPLLLLVMRGGVQKYPINKRAVYYSKHAVLNYASLNSFWNLMQTLFKSEIKENPYKYYSSERANKIMNQLHDVSSDTTTSILNTNRPNIVLILLESISAECMNSLNGEKGIMPKLDSLAKKGMLFTNFYANGFRTEQGLISLFSSFPAQPQTSIMREFEKFEKLPNLPKILNENGYSLNYYYSGNLVFANQIAYLTFSGFSSIYDKDNYTWNKKTQWGAYDEELFACHINESEKDKQPFFSVIMTSTNHESFDADVDNVFKGKSESDKYKNTSYYTDKCLADYLNKVKQKSWYKNTLFIITADHAHSYPKGRKANEAERHHIPFIIYGDVLKQEYQGSKISTIGSQIDFAATLLAQLNIKYDSFKKSKNLFNIHSPQFAFYTFDNGFGIITKEQTIIFDHNFGKLVYKKEKRSPVADEELTGIGKAYLQSLFEEYLKMGYLGEK